MINLRKIIRWLNEVHEEWKIAYLKKRKNISDEYLKAKIFGKLLTEGDPHLRFDVLIWDNKENCEEIYDGGLKITEVVKAIERGIKEGYEVVGVEAVTEYWKKGDIVKTEDFRTLKLSREDEWW